MVFRKIKTFQVSQGEPHGRTLLLIKASMFLVILLALMAKESLGQTSQIHPADPTFRAQSEMVVVPFHVILGNQYIDDLNRADIVLLEDGKLRPFQIFEAPASHRRLAIELVLLFDTNAPRHPNADRGVNDFWNPTRIYSFVNDWNDLMSARLLRHGDVDVQVSVYRFNESGLERLCPATAAPKDFLAGLQHLLQPSASPFKLPISLPSHRASKAPFDDSVHAHMYWPFECALGALKDVREPSSRLREMIIFSEGLSRTTTTPEDVAEVARSLGVSIFPVVLDYAKVMALTPDPDHDRTRIDHIARVPPGLVSAMVEFARLGNLTGGRSFTPNDIDSATLWEIVEAVKNAAQTQYVVGFALPQQARKGSPHKLEVRLVLKSRGKLTGGKRTVFY